MNNIIQTLKTHQSYRKYKDKKVSTDLIETVLEASKSAASWINGQQVTTIVVQDPERKKRMAALCGNQKHIENAPVFIIFCADFYRAKLASDMEGKSFQAIEDIDTLLVGATDVGLSMAYAIAAAESLGLGTVPIGGVRRNSLEVVKFLDLPSYVIPICGLCLGYPAEDPGIKPRLPLESTMHHEVYNQDQKDFLITYNETFKKYLKARGDVEANWTNRIANFYDQSYYPSIAGTLKKQGYTTKDIKE